MGRPRKPPPRDNRRNGSSMIALRLPDDVRQAIETGRQEHETASAAIVRTLRDGLILRDLRGKLSNA